jgi:hypothetical protein
MFEGGKQGKAGRHYAERREENPTDPIKKKKRKTFH